MNFLSITSIFWPINDVERERERHGACGLNCDTAEECGANGLTMAGVHFTVAIPPIITHLYLKTPETMKALHSRKPALMIKQQHDSH